MKTTIIYIILLILITGCKKTIEDKEDYKKVEINTGNIVEFSYEKEIKEVREEYRKDAQFDICMTNGVKSCLNQVVTMVAQKKSDYKICEDLSDKGLVEYCKEGLITNEALKAGDEKKCDKLGESKRNCYVSVLNNIALSSMDVNVCERILNEENVEEGTGIINNNVGKIDQKKICKNGVYMKIADSKKSIVYCNKIDDMFMKDRCKSIVKSSN